MYTNPLSYLKAARKGGCAVGAFNIENMEMAQAVCRAAAETNRPVIMQTTPSTVDYGGLEMFAAIARAVGEACPTAVALHLDHCESPEVIARALDCGYTSVMIDGSKLPFEENVAITRRAVDLARPYGVPVEGEIGALAGKEDGLSNATGGLTDPAEAARFVCLTGVDTLAVSIGTAHGIYKGKPEIRLDLLEQIAARVNIPLVLHGGSGLDDDIILACIARGIAKVNYATELRLAFTGGVRDTLESDARIFDPKTYLKAGREAVMKLVVNRIGLFAGTMG